MGSSETGCIGAYRIVRRWARGDTSHVYLARRGESTTLVALKTLCADRAHDLEQQRRFAREAALAEAADHEHLIQAFESFDHQGERFLATEFLHGETLHDVLSTSHRRMPAALALEIAHRLARGLHRLHQLGSVHGDLCPANVILTYDGRVKIIDLGGHCEGTSAYVAPEQARGEPLDPRADIFSLGLILIELLSGRRVRDGWSETEIVASAISSSVPHLSELVESDPDLDGLVMKAVARDRDHRYSDAAAFAMALLAYRERVVPGLELEAKLSGFMASLGRSASVLSAQLPGNRRSALGDPLLAKVPPLGHSDPSVLIETVLRAPLGRPLADPIVTDTITWNERTSSTTNDLGPEVRRNVPIRSIAAIGIGVTLVACAVMLAWVLLHLSS